MTNLEKLALDENKEGWEHLYIAGQYPSKPYPTAFETQLKIWTKGYNKRSKDIASKLLSLNPNLKVNSKISIPFLYQDTQDLYKEIAKDI